MPPSTIRPIAGRLVAIDLVARTLRIRVSNADREFTVLPGTSIHLNGEPVRLRMLQAGDPVEVQVDERGSETIPLVVRVTTRRPTASRLLPTEHASPDR